MMPSMVSVPMYRYKNWKLPLTNGSVLYRVGSKTLEKIKVSLHEVKSFRNFVNCFSWCIIKDLLSFQAGDTKLERFLPKNQHSKITLMNFENWCK